jgi:hypothetical protein
MVRVTREILSQGKALKTRKVDRLSMTSARSGRAGKVAGCGHRDNEQLSTTDDVRPLQQSPIESRSQGRVNAEERSQVSALV